MKRSNADGTYIMGGPNSLPFATLVTAVVNPANELSDTEVLAKVEFIAELDPRVPAHYVNLVARVANATRKGESNCRFALWPDGTFIPLSFNPSWNKPRDAQVIRAYRASRHVALTEALYSKKTGGAP